MENKTTFLSQLFGGRIKIFWAIWLVMVVASLLQISGADVGLEGYGGWLLGFCGVIAAVFVGNVWWHPEQRRARGL